MTKLAIEALVVGVVMATIFAVVHAVHMYISKKAAMTHVALLLQVVLVGFVGHIAFECSGVNKWYVRNYKS